MVIKKSSKYFFLGALAILVLFVLPTFILYPRFSEATHLIKLGDKAASTQSPQTALKIYTLAIKKWPPYKLDVNLKKKIDNSKAEIAKRPAFIVFFKDSFTENNVTELTNQLKNIQGVKDVKYVSKKDALNKYNEINKDSPVLLELVSESILPASLDVYLSDQSVKSSVVQVVKAKPYVDDVVVGEDY